LSLPFRHQASIATLPVVGHETERTAPRQIRSLGNLSAAPQCRKINEHTVYGGKFRYLKMASS